MFLNYNYNTNNSQKNINIFNKHINKLQENIVEIVTNNKPNSLINTIDFKEEFHSLTLNQETFNDCINEILKVHNMKLFINDDNKIDYCKKLYEMLNEENILIYNVNPDILLLL